MMRRVAIHSMFLVLVCGLRGQTVKWPEGRDRVEVPLRVRDVFQLGCSFVLDVAIAGKRRSFVLDTGASTSFVKPGLLKRLGLRPRGSARVVGITKQKRVSVYRVPAIRIGGLELEFMAAYASEPDVGESREESIDGLLGSLVFANLPFTIDAPHRKLVIHRRPRFRPPARATSVALSYGMGIPIARIGIDGGRRYRVDVDTGYNCVLQLNSPFVRRYGLLSQHELPKTPVVGVFGETSVSTALLGSVEIAGVVCRDVPVDLAHPIRGGANGNAVIVGTLGAGFFLRFRATFDYRAGKMWLEPKPGFDGRFPADLGLELMFRDGAIRVVVVRPGSPAAKAKLALGDRVTSIDGVTLAGKELAQAALMLHGKGRVRLVVRSEKGGEPREVTLERRPYLPKVEIRRGVRRR